HTDPYCGGEWSGKKAKPDAQSAPTITTQTQPPVASQPSTTSQPCITSICVPEVLTLVLLNMPHFSSPVPDFDPASITWHAPASIVMVFLMNTPSLTSVAPWLHMLAGPSQAFNVIPMAVSSQTFCPATFDLCNTFLLNMLK
ncbi:hypothetical protein L208DRAFT_1333405, partial [Tricholoma matsutake]